MKPATQPLSPQGEATQDLFKNTCRILTSWTIGRYLIVNADGRQDGAEKAQRHAELCRFYIASARGMTDPDYAGRDYPDDYERLHEASQELTSYMDTEIGFPIKGQPDYQALEPLFFERFHAIAVRTLGIASPDRDAARPANWQWVHERDAELIERDGWMCEQHPGQEFPHDDCAGPGQSWSLEGREVIEALIQSDTAREFRKMREAIRFALTTPGLIKGRDQMMAALTAADATER